MRYDGHHHSRIVGCSVNYTEKRAEILPEPVNGTKDERRDGRNRDAIAFRDGVSAAILRSIPQDMSTLRFIHRVSLLPIDKILAGRKDLWGPKKRLMIIVK